MARHVSLEARNTPPPSSDPVSGECSTSGLNLVPRRWATKKIGGSSTNGRDSNPQYRGIKEHEGHHVRTGWVLARQCGMRWHPGFGVGVGKDSTLFAEFDGERSLGIPRRHAGSSP